MENITTSLSKCAIELILCSPKSVKRPWINFEAGAGWVREIPVIPLCHSGMTPSELPIPLNLLQAANISDISSLKLIFPVLANSIEAKCPNILFDDFIENMKMLEKKYSFWDDINKELIEFNKKYIELFQVLPNMNIRTSLSEMQIMELEKILAILIQQGYIKLKKTGNYSFTTAGYLVEIELSSSNQYKNLFADKSCVFYQAY